MSFLIRLGRETLHALCNNREEEEESIDRSVRLGSVEVRFARLSMGKIRTLEFRSRFVAASERSLKEREREGGRGEEKGYL